MTRQEVDTILRSARRHAKLKGYSFEADDFSSYCLEKIYMGRKATIGQLFIDYLREEFGDSRKHLFKNDRINKSYELLGIEPDEKKALKMRCYLRTF